MAGEKERYAQLPLGVFRLVSSGELSNNALNLYGRMLCECNWGTKELRETQATMSAWLGKSDRKVAGRALEELERIGLIRKVKAAQYGRDQLDTWRVLSVQRDYVGSKRKPVARMTPGELDPPPSNTGGMG